MQPPENDIPPSKGPAGREPDRWGRLRDGASRWWSVRHRWRELPLGPAIVATAIGGALLILGLLVAWERCMPGGWCPDPTTLEAYLPHGAPVLLDRNGEQIADLHPLQQRVVPLDSMPAHLPAAFVAVEDRRFGQHDGIDWIRIPSAALQGQGGSTITMQLARTLFPELLPRQERSMRRKLQEMRIAADIERTFQKEEILELYANHVYLGRGEYGVEDASRHFFGRSAAELELEHSALLAGLARAPAIYDPRREPERARGRRDLVLRLMEEQGMIDPADADAARGRPLGVSEEIPRRGSRSVAPYFVEAVRAWLEERFDDELLRSPARIHTTLDPAAQVAAEEELLEQIRQIEEGEHGAFTHPEEPADVDEDAQAGTRELQGAVVLIDPRSGDLLALVGGRDFSSSTFDRAIRARRQVGSAFKPFVYAAALRQGFLQSQPIADLPFEVTLPNSSPWSPGNYDGGFRGLTNMREALVHSLNVPTARMGMAVGIESVVEIAREAGIDADIPETPAAALGAGTLTPLELAMAYTTFATLGPRPSLRIVTRIETETGEIVHDEALRIEEGIDPRVAFIVTDMLQDVVSRGTGAEVRRAGFGALAAGKTGTTQDARDVWFVGYTPDRLGVVWLGFDRPREIVPGATGGRLAAPTWARIMSRIYADRSAPEPWGAPDGVIETGVDGRSGMYVEEGCSPSDNGAIRVLFLEEHQPTATCPFDDGWINRLRAFFGGGSGGTAESETGTTPGHGAFDLGASIDQILGANPVPQRGSP